MGVNHRSGAVATGRAARTRREILEAAWELIAARGAAVSLAEVADAAGVTRQSVYVHFGSRGGLLLALVRRADERFEIARHFTDALQVAVPRDRFDACLRVWLDFVPKVHPVARHLIRLRREDAAAATAWTDRMEELVRLFRRLVKGLAAEGVLAPGWTVAGAGDYLWAGCSVQAWDLLVVDRGWSAARASKALRLGLSRALLA